MGLDEDTATVVATISANALLGGLFLILYEYSRGQRDLYAPRMRTGKYKTPGRPPAGVLGWVWHTLSVGDEDTLSMIGMDAFVVLRFLRLCAKMCGAAVPGALIMMPLYGNAPQQEGVYGINLYTMANIPPNGNLMWCCTVFSWAYSMYFIYLMREEYINFLHLRQKFLLEGDPSISMQRLLTVKVENIPAQYRSSVKLWTLFDKLFPNSVHSVVCNQSVVTLEACVANRDSIVKRLECCLGYSHVNDRQKGNSKGPPYLLIDLETGAPPYFYGGVPYNEAVQYYVSRLITLNEDVAKLQALALLPDPDRPTSVADIPYLKSVTQVIQNAVPVKALLSPMLHNPVGAAARSGFRMMETGVNDLLNRKSDEAATVKGVMLANEATAEAAAIRRKRRTKPVPPVPLPASISEAAMPIDDAKTLNMNYEQPEYSSTGFVTFNSRKAHALAYGVALLSHEFPDLSVEQAVEPDDIIWENVSVPETYSKIAFILTSAGYKSAMVFWTAILAFIAALSNLDNIAMYFPFVNHLAPTWYAFLAGLLPVVVMNMFLDLIPTIMEKISVHIEKLKSKSAVAQQVFKWFFYYSMSNIYLLLLTGSVFHSLSDAIDSPKSIFYLLGSALPSITLLFTNFLITSVLLGLPKRMLRLKPQLLMYYYEFIGNSSDTVTRGQLLSGPLKNSPYDYGSSLPNELYVLCIVMTYWTITPLIVILGALYFGGVFVVTKHKFLYVHTREYETGGRWWYGLFDNSMFCLVCSSVLMLAYVSIKEAGFAAMMLIPLPLVIYYSWCYISDEYQHKSNCMAYSIAAGSDETQEKDVLESLDEEMYAQPCLGRDAMESIPYPHRFYDPTGMRGKEPLLVEVSAESAGDLPSFNGSISDISLQNLKNISNVSAMHGSYTSLNTAYLKPIDPSVQEVDEFYAKVGAKHFPHAMEENTDMPTDV